ncbi:phage tail tube protein [Halomonas rhizosphaerae]|uniref:Phage tail tube protein n=1 Tax=Halomonas rhizosphaerae TaxID=3043296 RepID=A0ABT6V006_9GAMM|nr:phage tail tube protein [Halomonas rhizosphaerae]MDI5890599.1 phage tail tube protein [Halomonas rhizosphaerae]
MSKLAQGTHIFFLDPNDGAPTVKQLKGVTDFNPGGAPANQINETTLEDLVYEQSRSGLRVPGAATMTINTDEVTSGHYRVYELSEMPQSPNVLWAVGWSNGTEAPRTGGSVGEVNVDSGGSGYTDATVTLGAPDDPDGKQATASAVVSGGEIVSISVTEPGSGYETAPTVTISDSGSGTGATATATLGDTVFVLPTTRSWLQYEGYVADFPFNFATDSIVNTDVSVQRSGGLKWQKKAQS